MKPLKKSILLLGLILLTLNVIGLKMPRDSRENPGTASVPFIQTQKDTFNFHFDLHLPSFGLVCHITHDFVTVIDLNDNQVVDTIHAGEGTDWVAGFDKTSTGYITDFKSNDVAVINSNDPHRYSVIPVGEHPVCIRLTLDGKTALISHQSQDGLWFMDTKTREITAKIPEGTGMLYFLKNQNKFYQPAIFSPFIHIIDPVKQEITRSVWVGGRPMGLAFTPDGKYAYIPNYDLKEVQIFDTGIDSVVKVIPGIGNPRGIAITPDGKYALVTNVTSNTLTVIGIDSNAVAKVIPVDRMPTDVAVTEDGKYAYVTNQGSGSISVISLGKLEVVAHIEVPSDPITIFIP